MSLIMAAISIFAPVAVVGMVGEGGGVAAARIVAVTAAVEVAMVPLTLGVLVVLSTVFVASSLEFGVKAADRVVLPLEALSVACGAGDVVLAGWEAVDASCVVVVG